MRSSRALGWLLALAVAVQLARADLAGSAGAPPVQSPVQQDQQQQQQFQLHLSKLQAQAQRQLNHLVQSSQLANLTQAGAKQAANSVLEALGSVGKAIQAQVRAPGGLQSAPGNEYQPVEGAQAPAGGLGVNFASAAPTGNPNRTDLSYRQQGELLREEIVKRAGQLQQVVGSSLELLKSNGDLIVRRLLEQLNTRLDVAKSKADKIINEPTTNEMGLRALASVNQGLNNLNNIIANIVNKLDLNLNGAQVERSPQGPLLQRAGGANGQETPKYRLSLHQLGQQLSSAASAALQKQQQFQQQQPPLQPQVNQMARK